MIGVDSESTRIPALGELEAAVMERIWSGGPSDVKAVHRAVGEQRRITLNTVQSTMERLWRKGFLDREKVSHAYVYSARHTKAELCARMVEQVVGDVLRGEPATLLSAFVDLAARADRGNLDRLEALIAKRRGGGGR
jgi:predicted transcriptional regulator